MARAGALWAISIGPGCTTAVVPESFDIHITNVALSNILDVRSGGRTSITISFMELSSDGSHLVRATLCSLLQGKIEHLKVDLTLPTRREVIFEVAGENTVSLVGNYIIDVENPSDLDSMRGVDTVSPVPSRGRKRVRIASPEVRDSGIMTPNVQAAKDARVSEVHRRNPTSPNPARAVSASSAVNSSPVVADTSSVAALETASSAGSEQATGSTLVPTAANVTTAVTEASSPVAQPSSVTVATVPSVAGVQASKALTVSSEINEQVAVPPAPALPVLAAGHTVGLRYVAFDHRTKVVISSNINEELQKFTVGCKAVIRGLDDGVLGMKLNGERLLIIPPALAYGEAGGLGVPPNTVVAYQCKLVSLE
ncbi:hypothetical protein BKA93DRAFT_829490 [Sparassis latifolia]